MFLFTNLKAYSQYLQHIEDGCEQAVRKYLSVIEEKQELNAFVEVYSEEALQRARQLDEKRRKGDPTGKLHGVVIALKDVICYKDHQVSASSKMLENFKSIYSATAVQKLLDEDAVIIGTCNCDEFAMGSTNENSAYGAVLNALDKSKVPGGSSGGSAVAVQAGMCMVSLGSDTGGSVRQPADFCGIVGLKPTYGRISRYGLIAYASSFDQIGIFGNNIDDVEKVLEVISGADDYDSTVVPSTYVATTDDVEASNFRIAFFPEAIEHPGLDPEIKKATTGLLDKLSSTNKMSAVSFDLLDYVVPTYYVLTTAEASSNLSRYDGVRFGHRTSQEIADLTQFYKRNRSEGFGLEVKRRIMLGNYVLSEGYYDAYFTKAQQIRRRIQEKVIEIFKDHAAIIIPTVPSTAFSLGEMKKDPVSMYLADIYTVFANLAGIPAISVPLFKHSNGMPFGVQIMSNKMDELTLLKLSRQLMVAG